MAEEFNINDEQHRQSLIDKKRICCFCGVELSKDKKYTCDKCWNKEE